MCVYVSCLCLWAMLPDLNKMMMMMMIMPPNDSQKVSCFTGVLRLRQWRPSISNQRFNRRFRHFARLQWSKTAKFGLDVRPQFSLRHSGFETKQHEKRIGSACVLPKFYISCSPITRRYKIAPHPLKKNGRESNFTVYVLSNLTVTVDVR